MAITSVKLLWDDMGKQEGVKYLLTSRLNQDCLENLFSIVRAKGGARDNPNAAQFRVALAEVCDTLVKGHNKDLFKAFVGGVTKA